MSVQRDLINILFDDPIDYKKIQQYFFEIRVKDPRTNREWVYIELSGSDITLTEHLNQIYEYGIDQKVPDKYIDLVRLLKQVYYKEIKVNVILTKNSRQRIDLMEWKQKYIKDNQLKDNILGDQYIVANKLKKRFVIAYAKKK